MLFATGNACSMVRVSVLLSCQVCGNTDAAISSGLGILLQFVPGNYFVFAFIGIAV